MQTSLLGKRVTGPPAGGEGSVEGVIVAVGTFSTAEQATFALLLMEDGGLLVWIPGPGAVVHGEAQATS